MIFLLFSSIWTSCQHEVVNKELSLGQWITHPVYADTTSRNLWLGFEKNVSLEDIPSEAKILIAADTKYWLWINGRLAVREGGLKWGATPSSFYQDEVEVSQYLNNGKNQIQIAVWHFGRNGFSHKSSGRPALNVTSNWGLSSDSTWVVSDMNSFSSQSAKPYPNWRLSEGNIMVDAREHIPLSEPDLPLFGYGNTETRSPSKVIDLADWTPTIRPIPQWKNYGLKPYLNDKLFPVISRGDTLVMNLPYNAQVTPYFEIEAEAGLEVDIRTDNYRGGSEYNVRTNYITQSGRQIFETPGWMNGHEVRYYFPKGIKVHALMFRETGYNTEFVGKFTCSDEYFNKLWDKSARTLYITMRDNFMDCPDRERAQWWGDAVIQIGQCAYAFDRQSDLLAEKAILELMNWQREDSTIYSPVPAGSWDKELPTQMLASVGFYGIWNYYVHSGDLKTIERVYTKVRDYLDVWQTEENGLVVKRSGGWTWGDWGNHKDMDLIFNGWYYLALKGYKEMALTLDQPQDATWALEKMDKLKSSWLTQFSQDTVYRSPDYEGETDERGLALAVLADIIPEEQYVFAAKQLLQGQHCSPYFEKYVLEALIKMGYTHQAMDRMKSRYQSMVESPITTLWEGWQVGSATWGGGTYNHSWSGGPLTLMSQYIAGIQPSSPGYKSVVISPRLGNLNAIDATVATPLGLLTVTIVKENGQTVVNYKAPEGMDVSIAK